MARGLLEASARSKQVDAPIKSAQGDLGSVSATPRHAASYRPLSLRGPERRSNLRPL